MEKLYARRSADDALTLQEYEGLFPEVRVLAENGNTISYRGVSAAIKHAADDILSETGYAGLKVDDSRMRDLRRALYSLAQVDREGQFTRRTALWSQMPPSCKEVLDRFVSQRLFVSGTENGEPTLSVAHESLFRVWDTLHIWLIQDRKALITRTQIEDAAAEWEAENRAESRVWPQDRILDAVCEIARSGVSLDGVASPAIVRAFLGPTEPGELAELPALGEREDQTAGSGRYGAAWRLPLSHEARASVGVRLALLGDPRPGLGVRDGLPDIDWCRIEGGRVTIEIRAKPDDPSSEVVDTLSRHIASFWMARYPVTIEQFQAFLQDCYRDGRWQRQEGFPSPPADYLPPKHLACYGNHPADSVNWWDATDFCHWLSARLSERLSAEVEIRLPTEFEWQLAANGGDSPRTWPWGAAWDLMLEPWRANTSESRLGRSTAVGLFPLGASKAGVLDMAGTSYEWCSNSFDDPDSVGLPATEEDQRVLRGGSWDDYTFARCACRLRGFPNYRGGFVGFRVVSSSPIVGQECWLSTQDVGTRGGRPPSWRMRWSSMLGSLPGLGAGRKKPTRSAQKLDEQS